MPAKTLFTNKDLRMKPEKITQMGLAQSVKSSVTPCTLENLYAAMDAEVTNHVCAD